MHTHDRYRIIHSIKTPNSTISIIVTCGTSEGRKTNLAENAVLLLFLALVNLVIWVPNSPTHTQFVLFGVQTVSYIAQLFNNIMFKFDIPLRWTQVT